MKSRGAAKPPTFALPFAARACHARLARLTRARGRGFLRGWKILLNDFWYFSSQKSTIKEKFLYDSSLSEFFSLVRKERKGQKEECFDSRLGDADTLPRPSDYSIAAATGSKRSSADSDSLLCHVGLWQTSRFRFGCASVCEHSEIKFALHNTHVTPHPPLSRSPFSHWRRLIVTSVSAGIRPTPAPLFSAGVQTMRARICSASSCDMFARVV